MQAFKPSSLLRDSPQEVRIHFFTLYHAQYFTPDEVEHVLPDGTLDSAQASDVIQALRGGCEPYLQKLLWTFERRVARGVL